MKVYLAARYSRREEMVGVAEDLEGLGYTITSRWIGGSHQLTDHDDLSGGRVFAEEDLADVMSAQILIAFTEEPRTTNSRGGRHVELGIALGAIELVHQAQRNGLMHTSIYLPGPRRLLVVGPRENVFTYLKVVEHYIDWEQARKVLEMDRKTVA